MEFQTSFILLLLTGFTLVSCQKVDYRSYLERAIKMIEKAKYNIPTCVKGNNHQTNVMQKPVDCADVLQMGYNLTGVYEIWPMNRLTEGKPLNVYCDMDTDAGGWTVIQRRAGKSPKDYFHRDWRSYKEGFGDINADFWLGNNRIFALTNQKLYSVRFDLMDFNYEKRFALYDVFYIDDENHKFTLHISNYSGDAGDTMYYVNDQKFSTKDQDNDNWSAYDCAGAYKSGWWFNQCMFASLNGLYHQGKHETQDGILWKHWKGYDESLAWTEIKIRPSKYTGVEET